MSGSVNKIKQRDAWFDNSKGILMITVVVGHFIASLVNTFSSFTFLSNFIYFFHMPAFAIVSGYFMKRRVDTKDYASVINKTVIPYCFAQVIIYLFALILPNGVQTLSAERMYESGLFSFLFPIYHLWYFVGVVVAFCFLVFVNAKNHPAKAVIISIIISLVSGMVSGIGFLKLTKVLAFLPFFVVGYVLPEGFMNTLRKRILNIAAVVIVVTVGLVFWFLRDRGTLAGIFAMTWRFDSFPFDITFVQAIFVRLGFIVSSVIFSFALLNLCPRNRSVFTRLGEKSVYVYILHVVVVAIVRHFNYEYGVLMELNTAPRRILYIVFAVAVCYLLTLPPVVKVFKRFFEPEFDIRKINKYLNVSNK